MIWCHMKICHIWCTRGNRRHICQRGSLWHVIHFPKTVCTMIRLRWWPNHLSAAGDESLVSGQHYTERMNINFETRSMVEWLKDPGFEHRSYPITLSPFARQCSWTGLSKTEWGEHCLWVMNLKDHLGSFETSRGIAWVSNSGWRITGPQWHPATVIT
jgi:hypothetical protein